jgi:hypothetical protein
MFNAFRRFIAALFNRRKPARVKRRMLLLMILQLR